MALTRKADTAICSCSLLVYGFSSEETRKRALDLVKSKVNTPDLSASAVETENGPAVRFEWSSYEVEQSLLSSLVRCDFDNWINELCSLFNSTSAHLRIGSRMVSWK